MVPGSYFCGFFKLVLYCSTILTKYKSDLMTPRRYSMTKLLTIYISRELAALVPKASDGNPMVIVNCVS